jgi:hypothetical protein
MTTKVFLFFIAACVFCTGGALGKDDAWFDLTVYTSDWRNGVREPVNKRSKCSAVKDLSGDLQVFEDRYKGIGTSSVTDERVDETGKVIVVKFKVTVYLLGAKPWEEWWFFRDKKECLIKLAEVQAWYKNQHEEYKQKFNKYK